MAVVVALVLMVLAVMVVGGVVAGGRHCSIDGGDSCPCSSYWHGGHGCCVVIIFIVAGA